jgi:hypothetical protein
MNHPSSCPQAGQAYPLVHMATKDGKLAKASLQERQGCGVISHAQSPKPGMVI